MVAFGSAAQANNPAAAQALFEEGRTLLARGDLAAACAKFEGSQNLDPGPGTEYNLAICYEKSGKTASAWATYLSAAVGYKSTQRPDWEAKARERANALAPRLSKLTLIAPSDAPTGMRITRDGVLVEKSELGSAIPIDPGAHVIQATAPGSAAFEKRVEVAAGVSETVTVTMQSNGISATSSSSPTAAEPATTSEEASSPQRTWAVVVGGVGVAGLALGAIGGLVAIGENASSTKECPNDGPCASAAALRSNASARDWATVSTIAFAGGGALVALGVTLFLTAPSPHARTTGRAVIIAPTVGIGSVGMRATW